MEARLDMYVTYNVNTCSWAYISCCFRRPAVHREYSAGQEYTGSRLLGEELAASVRSGRVRPPVKPLSSAAASSAHGSMSQMPNFLCSWSLHGGVGGSSRCSVIASGIISAAWPLIEFVRRGVIASADNGDSAYPGCPSRLDLMVFAPEGPAVWNETPCCPITNTITSRSPVVQCP